MKRFVILLVDDEQRILNFLKTKLKSLAVTGHLKPATCGQFKSGHFEVVS
jgi:hypothetical protein